MNEPTEIPPRNTRAFAEYRAGVEWEAKHGAKIEYRWARHNTTYNHEWGPRAVDGPLTDWDDFDYRVAPAPPELHPIDQWRAMSTAEREGKVLEYQYQWNPEKWYATDDSHRANAPYRIRELTLAERNAAVRDKWEAMEETDRPGRRRDKEGKLWGWTLDDLPRIVNPEWAWVSVSEYRLVELPEPPKPRYVPWTRENCPVGAVVRLISGGDRALITKARLDSVIVSNYGFVDYQKLLRNYTMDDGTPCGTLEQPQP